MNIKNCTQGSSQELKGKTQSNKKTETNATKPENKKKEKSKADVVDEGKSEVDAATATNNLNVAAIENGSPMVAINSCNESECNKIQKQQKQYNNNNNNYNDSSNIDVQIFTNTIELNQVNLNSSSQSLSTAATSAEAAIAPALEIKRERQQQQSQPLPQQAEQLQQLIMPPARFSASVMSVKLRKSHSTPALKFAGCNNVDKHEIPSSNSNKTVSNTAEIAVESSNIAVGSSHFKQHEQFARLTESDSSINESINNSSDNSSNNDGGSNTGDSSISPNNNTVAATATATTPTPDSLRFGCAHYKRRAMFVTPCCNKFYKCRFCHDENESHHFDRKTLTELICCECNTRQKVQEQCEQCGVRFGKYTCLICNLFDDADKQQYHCNGCGICRIGGADNFFHCEVCNMCLPMQLKIDGHRCVENISRSHCPVCLGDIHTSRIPCHIPDCGHLLHKMCFDQLLASGHYTCPTCQTSLIDMTALWDYLDAQALRMPVPLKCENQRVHIFCNDCHKTSKAKFHFIGLKCVHCGAYNTTQDVKRRMSLVTDEPSSA